MMDRAKPITKPSRTDGEKNRAIRPRRSRPAMTAMSPATTANAAVRVMNSGESGAARPLMIDADITATPADTATTSWRDVPNAA